MYLPTPFPLCCPVGLCCAFFSIALLWLLNLILADVRLNLKLIIIILGSASDLTEHPFRYSGANGKTARIQVPLFPDMLLYCYHTYFLKKAIKALGLHVAGTSAKWLIGNHKCLLITLKKCGIKSKALRRNISLWYCSVIILEGSPCSGVSQFGVFFFFSCMLSFPCALTA